MPRISKIVLASAAGLALLIIAISGLLEFRGKQQREMKAARENAALRPPPKPPNCPDLPLQKSLRLSDGKLADVRIFKFERTIYYIPPDWLNLGPKNYDALGDVDRIALGLFEPDLHRVECPGVVHQITNGGLYLDRHVGIGFVPKPANNALQRSGPTKNASYFFAHKLRPDRERVQPSSHTDGLIGSMGHTHLDAYIYVAPDVGFRLTWHPSTMTSDEWFTQYRRYSSGPLSRTSPKPWEVTRSSREFVDLARSVRALHRWLSTPPGQRNLKPPE